MATAILPQPAPSAPVDLPLAQEIADDEGLGLPVALVLAELYRESCWPMPRSGMNQLLHTSAQ